ncbi:hypothetical protein GCM10011504_34140 [Siccirubricoccus deserti]|uniref:Uncharacterized protein n=1 Tax=Siccirubricoccus deserti TaxID=2013562 RepID=A0A9X0R3Z3_9PROT|nr:hypothetical protein [Siccirubricoccus deserti]MBC4018097.1 hypothetical protein [Siccirubricoccus deserti]GGC52944.1 hypothetical protein GCM10011504_34140 [Siccirubricoccus deserti]
MAEPVIGMDKDELKVLLRKSKSEPVNCAVAASGEDRTLGVIVLDKVKAPKAVSTQLEKRYPKATLVRWGKAEVDTENDPKLVIFTLNKNVTGLGKKLKKSLKGTGYTKVLINFEDGSPSEQELEEEGVQPGVGATPGAPPPSSMAEESESAEAKSADPPSPSPEVNASAEETESAERESEQEVEAEKAAPASPEIAAKHVASARAWIGTRSKVQAEVDKLKAEILKTYQGQEIVGEIEKAYASRIQPAIDKFDLALAQKLAEASKATDAAAQAKLGTEARAILGRYAQYVASEPLIKELDENPFTPLAIRPTVITTLKQLGDALR